MRSGLDSEVCLMGFYVKWKVLGSGPRCVEKRCRAFSPLERTVTSDTQTKENSVVKLVGEVVPPDPS